MYMYMIFEKDPKDLHIYTRCKKKKLKNKED